MNAQPHPLPDPKPTQTLQSRHLRIRRMRGEDVPAIMQIESVSFGRHHWNEDAFLNEMNNHIGRYFSLFDTAGEQPVLIGYGGFWHILDEAHVTTIAVRPDLRGQALGELLFVCMVEECYRLSVHFVTLEVRASNYSAQNLYYKYGLNSVGMRPKYYQDNQEDALIMTSTDICGEPFRVLYKDCRHKLDKRMNGFPEGFTGSVLLGG